MYLLADLDYLLSYWYIVITWTAKCSNTLEFRIIVPPQLLIFEIFSNSRIYSIPRFISFEDLLSEIMLLRRDLFHLLRD